MKCRTIAGASHAVRGGEDLVSVVIPCYNQAHLLSEAIESAVAQTYPHEVIVVDDGSTDDTSAVARRDAAVRLVRQANAGLATARNRGLAASRGAYLVFLDADDRLLPGALEAGVRALRTHPECVFVFGHHYRIDARGARMTTSISPCVDHDHYGALLRINYISNPAMVMYRRGIFDGVGPFDPTVDASADYDLYFRIARRFPIRCHHAEVVEYRVHDAAMTKKSALMLRTTLTVLGRQRRYARLRPEWREAYAAGRWFTGNYYGRRLTEDIKRDVAAGRWRRAVAGLAALLVYYPRLPARTVANWPRLALRAGASLRSGNVG